MEAKRRLQLRLKFLGVVFLLGFILIGARLFYWQIIKGRELAMSAESQHHAGNAILTTRGNILANDGSYLAARGESWLVFFEPKFRNISNSKIADLLSYLFVDSDEPDYQKMVLAESSRIKEVLASDARWMLLKHKVSPETKEKIEKLNIAGIGYDLEEARIYPEGSAAAHLLGFVGKNEVGGNVGYFGLEGNYDMVLSGKPGFISGEIDARGSPILIGNLSEVSSIGGINLITHIDKFVQIKVEEALKAGVERYGAVSGNVTVMNSKTGAIVAMTSIPSYDPGEYSKYSNELFKNPVVSDSFEPGSVFKVLVMGAALDAKVVEPESICDICGGPLKIDKYSIETWNKKYKPGSTMTDVIVNSDNVGMTFVGQKLGIEKMHNYLEKFGLGELTGIDLQGESTPKLREKRAWSVVDLATASFGQGIAVTPIQVLTAVAAIANDGVLMKPQVVDKMVGDGWEEDVKPEEIRRVLSKKAANEMSVMMAAAASSGEAKWTYLKGFRVAGKTGTAQIPIAGHYDAEKTIASFVGFAPVENPKFVMLVSLREPQSSPWASETVAPLWYSIAKDLFVYYGIQPES